MHATEVRDHSSPRLTGVRDGPACRSDWPEDFDEAAMFETIDDDEAYVQLRWANLSPSSVTVAMFLTQVSEVFLI